MMEKLQHQYSADALSEAFDVSESGFAAHRGKQNGQRWKEDAELGGLIAQSFEQSRSTYGSPRVRLDLRELGHRCGKNRVARLMRKSGLRARQKRRFRPRTTESHHNHKIAENSLAKVPAPDRPGQLWQSDITYIETQEGWLYLAFTLDACSRRCIAHHCRQDMLGELTTRTFKLIFYSLKISDADDQRLTSALDGCGTTSLVCERGVSACFANGGRQRGASSAYGLQGMASELASHQEAATLEVGFDLLKVVQSADDFSPLPI